MTEKGRMKVFPGYGGSRLPAKRTAVEFPFTELAPTIAGGGISICISICITALDQLTPHQRDVAIANLCAKYGNVQQ